MSNTGIHAMNRPEVRDLFELQPRGEPVDHSYRVAIRNTDTGAMIANPDGLAALVFLFNGLARRLDDTRRAAESPAPAAVPALPPSPALPAPPASAVRAPGAAAKAPRTAGRGR